MQVARTEHVISLIYGIPTVIGGVNGGQFISSMEQFDKSEESIDAPFQREWNINNQVEIGVGVLTFFFFQSRC